MTYQEALELIKEEYDTNPIEKHATLIYTGLTYNGCTGFCVVLYDLGDKAILTDLGKTKDVFDEVDYETWRELCESHGFIFNHWKIQREFNSIEDVDEFIRFLDSISVRYYDEVVGLND